MYEGFFGLRERPFDLAPNPRYLFLTRKHQEALSTLCYGLYSGRCLTLVTGEAGTGKTTLIHTAFGARRSEHDVLVTISNPTLTRAEFIESIARGFGLSDAAARSKPAVIAELSELAAARRTSGGVVGLIVDEAQALSDELLEEVRLLANIETSETKLLPLVLAGQPELADRLNRAEFRQLKQRIELRSTIDPLDLRETAAYITVRIWVAGGNRKDVFTREAVEAIYERSGGIPRTICVIGDNALIAGFANQERPVRRDTVLEVCRDLDLDAALVSGMTFERLARRERDRAGPAPAGVGPLGGDRGADREHGGSVSLTL
jgi:general secretion pathway protein A